MPDAAPSRRSLVLGLLLALATLAVYWPARQFEYNNFDDQDYVSENPMVQQGLTVAGAKWAFTTGFAGNWHPVTWLSHMLDCQVFGVNPGAHHLVNVLFHILNTLLLFVVLKRMTGAEVRSALVAALFALHPLHVESVAWVAERKDVLSTFFGMLTVWAYARYAARPKAARYLPVLLFFALGLMAKPMLVTLPCVLLLLDYWPLGRLDHARWATMPRPTSQFGPNSFGPTPERRAPALHESPNHTRQSWSSALRGRDAEAPGSSSIAPRCSWSRLVIEKLPLFLLALGSCVVTFFVQQKGGAVGTLEKFPLAMRLANSLITYVAYLGKMLVPAKLAAFYPYPDGYPVWQVAGAGLVLVVVTALAVAWARRRPYLLVGWLWYLGTLVPVVGLVQVGVQSMADRYTYLPLIGPFVMVVWGVADLAAGCSWRRAALGAGAALALAGCLVVSSFQVQHWRSSVTLFRHALAVTTNNSLAHYNLAQALSMQGELKEPLEHYREALRIKPDYGVAHNNLGLTLVMLGKPTEATNHYAEAVRLSPANAEAHYNYGLVLTSLGQPREAVAHLETVLRLTTNNCLAYHALGQARLALNQTNEAIAELTEALRLAPAYAEAHDNLGLALSRAGRGDEAIAHFQEAARLRPELPEAHLHLALAMAGQRKPGQAIAQYREALRWKPDYVEALNNLAWLLATHPAAEFRDGEQAVQFAERACKLTAEKVPFLVGTLAAAYAEAGQFEKAIATAQRARDLAASAGQTELAARNGQLLELYRAGKPYREGQ